MTERNECMKMINVCFFRQICSPIHFIHLIHFKRILFVSVVLSVNATKCEDEKLLMKNMCMIMKLFFAYFFFFSNIFKELCLSDITIWPIWILLFVYIFLNLLINVHQKILKRIQIISSLFHNLNSVIRFVKNSQSRQKTMTNHKMN